MIQQFDFEHFVGFTKLPGSEGLWWPELSADGRYILAETATAEPRLILFDFF